MFEDSTFESMGLIHTRSRGWMMATFALNSSILTALIFIPLIYPSVLPKMPNVIEMILPPVQVEDVRPVQRMETAPAPLTQMQAGVLTAPSTIPRQTYIPTAPETPIGDTVVALANGAPIIGMNDPFDSRGMHPDVRQAVQTVRHVSSGVMTGMLVHRVVPVYPPIARAIRLTGTVVLQATISRTGAIENLQVVSGPEMLQQAAKEAVSQWRYRPYLLNGEPVEVETTVNVEFTMN